MAPARSIDQHAHLIARLVDIDNNLLFESRSFVEAQIGFGRLPRLSRGRLQATSVMVIRDWQPGIGMFGSTLRRAPRPNRALHREGPDQGLSQAELARNPARPDLQKVVKSLSREVAERR